MFKTGSTDSLQFPHAEFRSGQRELAEAVYKSATIGCCLMAQTPTGIGKTMGTLFPLLKASPVQELDKIFTSLPKLPAANWPWMRLILLNGVRRDCNYECCNW